MDAVKLYRNLMLASGGDSQNRLYMGQYLYELKKDDTWKEAVGDVETWQQFLKQPEIGLSVHLSRVYTTLYTKLVLESNREIREYTGVSYQNLLRLAKLDEVTDDLVNNARTLSDRDFKELIAEQSVENYTPTYTYLVMRRCNETGNMRKVHGIESDDIISKLNIHE